MHGTDYSALMIPGKLLHLVYRKPPKTADEPPEISERVIQFREMQPDGLSFKADCLRRAFEGDKPGRCFLFARIITMEPWDGEAILDVDDKVILPDAITIAHRMNLIPDSDRGRMGDARQRLEAAGRRRQEREATEREIAARDTAIAERHYAHAGEDLRRREVAP